MRSIPSGRTLYAVLSVIPFIVAVIGYATLLHAPYMGITFEQRDGKWFAGEVAHGGAAASAGIEAGQQITAIGSHVLSGFDLVEDFDYIPDRQSLVRWWTAQRYFSENVRPFQPIVLTLDSGDRVTVVPSALRAGRILERAGLMYVLGLLSLLIGLGVAYRKPSDERARVFFFMVLSVAVIFVTFGSYTSRETGFDITVFTVFRLLNVIAFAYFPVLFIHFGLVFPMRKKPAESRAFIRALYLLPVVVSALYQPRISYLSLNLLFMAGLIGGAGSVVYSYFRASSPQEKYQVRWVIWGVGMFASVFMATTFLPILFSGQRLFGDRVPSLFFILVPLSMAFAITKYHLMDIDTVFDTTIIYALTLVVITLLDLGLLSALSSFLNLAVGIDNPMTSVIALWFAVLAYIPVRNSVSSAVKRLLKRDVYDPHEAALFLGSRLLAAENTAGVLDAAVDTVNRLLRPKGFAVVMARHGMGNMGGVICPDDDRIDVGAVLSEAAGQSEPRPVFKLGTLADSLPADYSEGVLVPLRASMGTMGFILLMNRLSGKLYTTRDLKLLKTVANQTAMALESITRKEENERREREARRERERISREIHDGIGSSFTNSIMMLDLLEKDIGDIGGEMKRFTHLKTQLAEGLTELRDLIWTIEEEEYRLGDLVSHIIDKADGMLGGENVTCRFDISVGNDQIPLSAMIRLNSIRIVQESITNVLKHSGATEVVVSVKSTPDEVRIAVSDNGCGFDVASARAGRYGLRNIGKRCEEMGGVCRIVSEPGKGTMVEIAIRIQDTGGGAD